MTQKLAFLTTTVALAIFVTGSKVDDVDLAIAHEEESCSNSGHAESCELQLRQLRAVRASPQQIIVSPEQALNVSGASHMDNKSFGVNNLNDLNISLHTDAKLGAAAAGSVGKCTEADAARMMHFGPGSGRDSFPKKVSNCGHRAYKWWKMSWIKSDMVHCLQSRVGLSAGCADCFAETGQYGFNNCKSQCLFHSWCSAECLNCASSMKEPTQQCAGVFLPQPTHC
jgi:hypothetical protein